LGYKEGALFSRRRFEDAGDADKADILRGHEAARQVVKNWLAADPRRNKCRGLERTNLKAEVKKALSDKDDRDPESVLGPALNVARRALQKPAIWKTSSTNAVNGQRLTPEENADRTASLRQVAAQFCQEMLSEL